MNWLDKYSDDNIPNLQQGGKVKKPLYVNDVNDPRYRAYQDSLLVYKGNEYTKDYYEKNIKPNLNKKDLKDLMGKWYNEVDGKIVDDADNAEIRLEKLNKKPYKYKTNPETKDEKTFGIKEAYYPQQPIEVKKSIKSKQPIIVSDKNDPRYVAYNDSLTLYNATKGSIDKLKSSKTQQEWFDYTKDWGNKHMPTALPAANRLKKLNKIQPSHVKSLEKFNKNSYAGEFKKPTQPVVLKQRDKLKPIENNLQSADLIQPNNQLQGEQPIPIARVPKKYKVETSGGGKFGGWKNISVITDPSQLSEEVGSKRTITPIYQEGGNIKTLVDPETGNPYIPLEGVELTQYDKKYPYYQNLLDKEKKYINDNSPIGRNIRAKALSGKGFTADDASGLFGNLLGGAFEIAQIPQSAMVESIEAIRGKKSSFKNIHPELGGKQRVPSEVWGYENPNGVFENTVNIGMDAFVDPTLITGGLSTLKNPKNLYKSAKNVIEDVENYEKAFNNLNINHALFDFSDLDNLKNKYKNEFESLFGTVYDEKDLGIYVKNKEIHPSRIKQQYEDPDIMKLDDGENRELFSMENRRYAKELTDNFIKTHDISNNYTDREKLITDLYSWGYDDKFNGRYGYNEYMPELYKPLRKQFQDLILKNRTKKPEVLFRESNDYLLNNVWDDAGNKLDPIEYSKLQKGYVYEPEGFTSTTLSPRYLNFGNILSKINVPENHPILNINSTGVRQFYNEAENVLPSGIKFRIDDIAEEPLEVGKGYFRVYNKSILPNELKKGGNIKKDNMGYWNPNNWGNPVEINSNNITMQGVYEPLIGISKQTGEKKMMMPGKNYKFANTKQVVEYPLNNNWLDKY